MSNFTISPSPHVHGGDSIEKNMYGVLIALVPTFIFSIVFFGLGAILVTLTSVAACLVFEYVIQKYLMKQRPTIWDGSAIITGVLLAFNLPSSLPLWIVVIGALVAIGIGKMSFGGLGNNIFNPALVGRVFLLISFPVQMTTWPVPNGFATVIVFSGILNLADPAQFAGPVFHLFTGGLMLGAIFMATDYVTSPMTHKGMLIYGVGIGLLTVIIRVFGAYPEGMSFAILIMNGFTPLINRYCKPKRFA